MKVMKIAVLHDYLNQFGGAERVLQTILEIFPDSDLYTLLYDKEKTFGFFEKNIKGVSFLNCSWIRKHHRLFIPFMPFAAKILTSKKKYDLMISSTAGYGKAINTKGDYHISYCHTPLRYAWEDKYLKSHPFLPWFISRIVFLWISRLLRRWDKKTSNRVNIFIANSNFIAQKIKNYYNRDAEVVYPPVDLKKFFHKIPPRVRKEKEKAEGYYLMVGRLLYYKGFDIGIKAFNELGKNLKIVGRGPEEKRLKKLAKSPHIQFIGNVSDKELRALYGKAKAFIFPQIEDFGLVAAEAQACGVPVIAFGEGGGAEIVKNGETGIIFSEQTPECLIKAVKEFELKKLKRGDIIKNSQRFSKEKFKKDFIEVVKRAGIKLENKFNI